MNAVDKAKRALLSMQRYSWEQGTAAQAFLEAGDLDIVVAMAHEAVNRQEADGRLASIGAQSACTDPMAILEALVKAVEITQDEKLKAALDRALEWALRGANRSGKGVVYHVDNAPQFWVDSLYMLPPGLVKAGYESEGIKQADGYIERLYIPERSLFKHIWDEEARRFVVDKFWGVGNGWALCGLTRMIESITDEGAKNRYIRIVRDTLDAALKLQRSDKLFHNFLDEPDSFIEVNFPQMMCYAIKKGVAGGWLDEGYMRHVPGTLDAVLAHLDDYGILHEVCGAPHFNRQGFAPEGQAFFILSRL